MRTSTKYFGKTIAEHMDAGTCWLCGQKVDFTKGIHGATGAHWSCSKKLDVSAESAFETMDRLIAEAKKQARRN